MEKQSTKTRKHICNRLLKKIVDTKFCFFLFFLILYFPLSSELAVSDTSDQELLFTEVVTENTSLERTFILDISSITPSRIQTKEPVFSDGVSVIEYQKTGVVVDRTYGTRLTLVLKFKNWGTWQLSEIPLVIDGNNFKYAQLPLVFIREDFSKRVSRAYFSVSQTIIQGKKIPVSLEVQNCSKVLGIHNDLTTDSLFELSKMQKKLPYTVPESSGFTLSNNNTTSVTIAIYNYIALESGYLTMPSVQVSVIGQNGKQETIKTEPFQFMVEPATAHPSATLNNLFSNQSRLLQAQLKPVDTIVPEVDKMATEEEIEVVQAVVKSAKQKMFLLKIGIKILLVFAIICAIIGCILMFTKSRHKMMFLVLALMCVLGVCLLYIPVSKHRGVCFQTNLQTIPELNARTRGSIENGTWVHIKRESGDWYLIQLDDKRSGWIPQNKCIDIK
jgi:hypothetical protein